MAKTTINARGGDLLLDRQSVKFSMESGTVQHTGVTASDDKVDPVGQPVKLTGSQWQLVLAGDEANATGLIVHGVSIPILNQNDITPIATPYSIVARQATINENAVAANDVNGAALNLTNLKAALVAEPILMVFRVEPVKQTIQTVDGPVEGP